MRNNRVSVLVIVPLLFVAWIGVNRSDDDVVSLTGTVVFAGTVPASMPINMAADDYCDGLQQGTPVSTPVVVDGQGRVADVLVYVKEGVSGGFPDPEGEVVLGQSGCRYTPRVVAVRTGQTLRIRNDDDTFHNVHVLASVNRSFNIGQPIKGMQARRQFDDPEIGVDVKCDVHGWMQGYVHVLDNPFYAVTGGDGAFDLGSLPSGNYVVEAWHATLGSVTQSVEISAGQPASLELRFR